MSRPACSAPIAFDRLVEYWLGELDEAGEALVDEHLLGCGECSENLRSLVGLAGGVRTLVRQGAVQSVVTDAFLARLAAHGLRLREYRVPCNGSVHCTVAPDDDVLVSRLEAPLAGVEQVDAVLLAFGEAGQQRLRDVPFNRSTGEVVLTPRIENIRAAGAHTARVQLLAVDRQSERLIGEYTFNHTPWPGG
jgi:Putative zinc-finger